MESKEKNRKVSQQQLLKIARDRSGLSQALLNKSLHAILAAISESVNDGNVVVLDDFGKFGSKTVKEHTVTPPSHEPVTVPEHVTVKFKAFQNFMLYHMK